MCGPVASYVRTRALQTSAFTLQVDDRLIMASDGLIAPREFGVCLEQFTPITKSDVLRSPRMVKYAAQYPIRQAPVVLDGGEPDFPWRIVGHCQESPREHIFSFDRITRSGSRLR